MCPCFFQACGGFGLHGFPHVCLTLTLPTQPAMPTVPMQEPDAQASRCALAATEFVMVCLDGFARWFPPHAAGAAAFPLQEPDPQAVTRDTVAALLDGATALHCAAIRGNPAQVDHLLLCGADPLAKNAAGGRAVCSLFISFGRRGRGCCTVNWHTSLKKPGPALATDVSSLLPHPSPRKGRMRLHSVPLLASLLHGPVYP